MKLSLRPTLLLLIVAVYQSDISTCSSVSSSAPILSGRSDSESQRPGGNVGRRIAACCHCVGNRNREDIQVEPSASRFASITSRLGQFVGRCCSCFNHRNREHQAEPSGLFDISYFPDVDDLKNDEVKVVNPITEPDKPASHVIDNAENVLQGKIPSDDEVKQTDPVTEPDKPTSHDIDNTENVLQSEISSDDEVKQTDPITEPDKPTIKTTDPSDLGEPEQDIEDKAIKAHKMLKKPMPHDTIMWLSKQPGFLLSDEMLWFGGRGSFDKSSSRLAFHFIFKEAYAILKKRAGARDENIPGIEEMSDDIEVGDEKMSDYKYILCGAFCEYKGEHAWTDIHEVDPMLSDDQGKDVGTMSDNNIRTVSLKYPGLGAAGAVTFFRKTYNPTHLSCSFKFIFSTGPLTSLNERIMPASDHLTEGTENILRRWLALFFRGRT